MLAAPRVFTHKDTLKIEQRASVYCTFDWQVFLLNVLSNLLIVQRRGSQQKNISLPGGF